MLTVLAPAKLNLTLEVLARRPDGFHEIRSVVQTINLYDSLHFYLSQDIEFRCDKPDWIPELSLIPKAASLLQETTGCSKGVIIEIKSGSLSYRGWVAIAVMPLPLCVGLTNFGNWVYQ